MTGTARGDVVGRVLRRVASPPGPVEPEAAATWDHIDDEARRRLRRASIDPAAAAHVERPEARHVVDLLAAASATRRPVDIIGPVLTGLLVLSTIWGFGRAAVPEHAGWFLLGALMAMALTCAAGWRRAAARRAGARAVRQALRVRGG